MGKIGLKTTYISLEPPISFLKYFFLFSDFSDEDDEYCYEYYVLEAGDPYDSDEENETGKLL